MNLPLEDERIGLFVYNTDTPGLKGVIKSHPSDFRVSEVVDQKFMSSLSPEATEKDVYPIFHMRDTGTGAFNLLHKASKELDVPENQLRLLGLKDATAEKNQLLVLTTEDFRYPDDNDFLTLAGWTDRPPTKRILRGNRFTIVVRETEGRERIEGTLPEFVAQMQHRGIPNFFGYQRFGEPRQITHKVGELIASGRTEEAVKLYLTDTNPYESEPVRRWRNELRETWDYRHALTDMPAWMIHERRMLTSLTRRGEDYAGALRNLPLSLRRLFVQAFQSHLFNVSLSRRIESGIGLREPVRGDLIYDARKERISLSSGGEREVDVMLPLVGYSGIPCEGEQKLLVQRVLREHGVSPQDFYVEAMPEESLRGSLRTATQKIEHPAFAPDHDKRTLTCTFTLGKGSYATVFLRELMKPKRPFEQGF